MADLFTYKKLPPDPCLTGEQMMAYIDGKLSVAEQHACEKHMADCALCEDALEGLSLVKDRSALAFPLKKQNEQPNEAKVVPLNPSPNRMRIVYAAAAVLVLVLGSVFILKNLSSPDAANELAENNSVADSTSVADADQPLANAKADCLKNYDVTITDKNSPVLQQTTGPVPADINEGQGSGIVFAEQMPESRTGAGQDEVMYDFEPAEDIVLEKSKEQKNDDEVNDDQVRLEEEEKELVTVTQESDKKEGFFNRLGDLDVSKPKANADAKTTLSKDNDGAKKAEVVQPDANVPASPQATGGVVTGNNQGTDLGNVSDSTFVAPGNPSVSEQNYQAGMDMLNAGQPNSAIIMFDKVLLDPKNLRYEDAEFQKANALIKANRKEEAKTLLKSIETKKGKHAAEATELLKTL